MHDQLTLEHHQPATCEIASGSAAEKLPGQSAGPVIARWTGREARLLRLALRMTNIEFAAHLGVSEYTVNGWNTRPRRVPVPELQRALDTALFLAPVPARERFAITVAGEAA